MSALRTWARSFWGAVGTVVALVLVLGFTPDARNNGVLPTASVSLAEMENLAQSTVIGRAAGAGTGVPQALTATQATALLDVATTGVAGTVKVKPAIAFRGLGSGATAYVVTNMAAAITEVSSAWRDQTDLANFTEFRLLCRQQAVAVAGSELCVGYTTDLTGAAGLTHLDGTAITSACDAATGFAALSAVGPINVAGAWATIHASARTDVLLTIYADDGDGAADPSFFDCVVLVR